MFTEALSSRLKGNYSEGFGQELHRNKWLKKDESEAEEGPAVEDGSETDETMAEQEETIPKSEETMPDEEDSMAEDSAHGKMVLEEAAPEDTKPEATTSKETTPNEAGRETSLEEAGPIEPYQTTPGESRVED